MKTFMDKMSKNKGFQIFRKIFSTIMTILLFLLFVVILVQKVSNNQINLGGFGIYTVASGSMEPEYKVRDLILASKVDAHNIEIGDDVVYLGRENNLAGKIIAHRVIEKNDDGTTVRFITKGIANDLSDPEIDSSQIMGVVKHKLYLLSFCSHAINNIYGLIFLIVIPFIVFIFIEGKHAIDEAFKDKE